MREQARLGLTCLGLEQFNSMGLNLRVAG